MLIFTSKEVKTMVDFGEIINSSASWTITVLFKPFNFKKWLILTFVVIMAGAMSNGCNFRSGFGGQDGNHGSVREEQAAKSGCQDSCSERKITPAEKKTAITVVAIVAAFILALAILFTWLCSRFSFVFIEDIIKNDASIRAPFSANAGIGNSYFRFNVVVMFIFLAALGALIFMLVMAVIKSGLTGVSNPTSEQLLRFFIMLIPVIVAGIAVFSIAALAGLITVDFVLPIMYKERLRILSAWGKAWALVRKNIWNFAVYVLIKIGLGIGAAIAYLVIFIAAFLIIAVPIVLLIVALYFLSKAVPPAAVMPYYITVGAILTPVCLFLLYCLMALNLPFAVFFRSYSMKFLERLDPQYALIQTEKQVAPQQ